MSATTDSLDKFFLALKNTANWFRCGIERECLRADNKGMIATDFHPTNLGAKLTHPQITTDFGEAQLELITNPYQSTQEALAELEQLHVWTWQQLSNKDQIIWPYSMPCGLPEKDQDITIAFFGNSNYADLKHIYRVGLTHRYGHAMQTISGAHINLSLSDSLLDSLARQQNQPNTQKWRNQLYFALMRNYRRHTFAINYLLGATPVIDQSLAHLSRTIKLTDFFSTGKHGYGCDTLIGRDATSLRQSDIGYVSLLQRRMNMCFNHLESYIQGINDRIQTAWPEFSKIGIVAADGKYKQLGDGILQIENEYYTSVRPKKVGKKGERALLALANNGVEYIELRNIDINPFSPYGIDQTTLDFMVLVFLWCAAMPSAEINAKECKQIEQNEIRSAVNGRADNTMVFYQDRQQPITHSVAQMLDQLGDFANILAKAGHSQYSDALTAISTRKLLSKQIEDACSRQHYRDFCIQLARLHQQSLPALSQQSQDRFSKQTIQSIKDFEEIESSYKANPIPFDTFFASYLDGSLPSTLEE